MKNSLPPWWVARRHHYIFLLAGLIVGFILGALLFVLDNMSVITVNREIDPLEYVKVFLIGLVAIVVKHLYELRERRGRAVEQQAVPLIEALISSLYHCHSLLKSACSAQHSAGSNTPIPPESLQNIILAYQELESDSHVVARILLKLDMDERSGSLGTEIDRYFEFVTGTAISDLISHWAKLDQDRADILQLLVESKIELCQR